MRKHLRLVVLVALPALALDVASKQYALAHAERFQPYFHAERPMAWMLYLTLPVFVPLIACLVGIVKRTPFTIAGGLVIAAGLGNTGEWILRGAVTDWITIGHLHANIADFEVFAAVTILLAWTTGWLWRSLQGKERWLVPVTVLVASAVMVSFTWWLAKPRHLPFAEHKTLRHCHDLSRQAAAYPVRGTGLKDIRVAMRDRFMCLWLSAPQQALAIAVSASQPSRLEPNLVVERSWVLRRRGPSSWRWQLTLGRGAVLRVSGRQRLLLAVDLWAGQWPEERIHARRELRWGAAVVETTDSLFDIHRLQLRFRNR